MPRIPEIQPARITNLPPLQVAEIERTGRFGAQAAERAGSALVRAGMNIKQDLDAKLLDRNDTEFRSRIFDLRRESMLQPDADLMQSGYDQGAEEITSEIIERTPRHLRDRMAAHMERSVESGRMAVFEEGVRRRRGEAIEMLEAGNQEALRQMAHVNDPDEFFEIISAREAAITRRLAAGTILASDAEKLRKDLLQVGARNEALRLIHSLPEEARQLIGDDPFISANLHERDRLYLELPLRMAEERALKKRSRDLWAPLVERLAKGEVIDDEVIRRIGPESVGGDSSLDDSDWYNLLLKNEANKARGAADRIALQQANMALTGERGPLENTIENQDAVDAIWTELMGNEEFAYHDLDVLDRSMLFSDFITSEGIAPRTYTKKLKADLLYGRSAIARGEAAVILDRADLQNPGAIEFSAEERALMDRIALNVEAGQSIETAVENTDAAVKAWRGKDPAEQNRLAEHAIAQAIPNYASPSEYAMGTSLWKQRANQVGSFGLPLTDLVKSIFSEFDVTEAGERGIRVELFAERLAEVSQLGTEMRDGFLRGWYEFRDGDLQPRDIFFAATLAVRTFQAISEGEPEFVPPEMLDLIDELAVVNTINNGGDAIAGIQSATKMAFDQRMFGWSTSRATQGLDQNGKKIVEWTRYAPELHYPMHWRNAAGAKLIREQAMMETARRMGMTELTPQEAQALEDRLIIAWNPGDGFRNIGNQRLPVYYIYLKGDPLSANPDEIQPRLVTDQFGRAAAWYPDPNLLPDKLEEKAELKAREEEVRMLDEFDRVLYRDALENEGFASRAPLGPVYIPRGKPVDPAIITEETKAQMEALRGVENPIWTRYLQRIFGNDRPATLQQIEEALAERGRDVTTEREMVEKTAAARLFVKHLREGREKGAERGF